MNIDLSERDVAMLRDLLQHKLRELDKEISRTDSRAFKEELHQLDRAIERVLAMLSAALEQPVAKR